jgi:hypothetical protein
LAASAAISKSSDPESLSLLLLSLLLLPSGRPIIARTV